MLAIIPGELDLVRELILEYASSTGVDLSFQNFQDEIASLESFYEATWLARVDGERAGCVALRRIDAQTCEMKRLYVRPQFRGKNVGHALAVHIIDEARSRGYHRMRLDTLPAMIKALQLYRSLGFVEIEAYRFNPVEGSVFMELSLQSLP